MCAFLNYALNQTDYYRGRDSFKYNITEANVTNWRTISYVALPLVEDLLGLYK